MWVCRIKYRYLSKKKIKKAQIYSLDNPRKGSAYNQNRLRKFNIKNFNMDIEKYNKIKLLPKFNLVIDCCAEPAIEASKKDPTRVFNTNLVGTFNILNKCMSDNSNMIFLSSSRVYSIERLRKLIKTLNIKTLSKLIRKLMKNLILN